jgi:hypothetical protein
MKTLEKIGLKQNWIYEVLMETGGIHRAAIGIWTEDFETFIADIYKDSSTYSNLMTSGIGTVYFVEDPRYFADTKDIEYFARADFKVVEKLPGSPTRFVFKVLRLDVLREGRPVNRAQGMFLEYLVDRSRQKVDEGSKQRAKYYKRTIQKVAPGSAYDRLVERLSKPR